MTVVGRGKMQIFNMTVFLTLLVLCAQLMTASAGRTRACAPGCKCPNYSMACTHQGLTALPKGTWPGVGVLDLSHNNISDLRGLGQHFPGLSGLFMRQNALTVLDLGDLAGPGSPPGLSMVDVSQNSITQVVPPTSVEESNRLALLYLGSNNITRIHPHAFRDLPRLDVLSLDNNPLEVPSGRPLLAHGHLHTLHMARADASGLSPATFAEMPKLKNIDLDNTGVRNISGVFRELRHLEKLSAGYNRIQEIVPGTFSPRASLVELFLDQNPLRRLDIPATPMARHAELHIDATPLVCECAHEAVVRWAAKHPITLLADCEGKEPCSFAHLAPRPSLDDVYF